MNAEPVIELNDAYTGIALRRAPCPSLDPVAAVWWCELAPTADRAARAGLWLSTAEHARAARFGNTALRERYIMGRATLRLLLSNALGIPPKGVGIERGYRGRPRLAGAPGLDFNVTHTGALAAYVIGQREAGGLAFGIDIELCARQAGIARLARKLLTASERARLEALTQEAARLEFLRTWTCKEAMSKATGDGLAAPFGSFSVESGDLPQVLEGPPPYAPGCWALHRVPMPVPAFVTVAVHRP